MATLMSIVHFGKDGAGSNRRLTAHMFKDLSVRLPNTLFSELECSLHANDLIKGFVIRPYLWLVKKLYSVCSLTAMGSNFLRLLHFLPNAVNKSLTVHMATPPPPHCPSELAFRSQLLDYVKMHYRHESRRSVSTSSHLTRSGSPRLWPPDPHMANALGDKFLGHVLRLPCSPGECKQWLEKLGRRLHHLVAVWLY